MTRIVSYNINGIRSGIRRGLVDWLDENDFDIVCFQEVKAHSGSVPVLLFESLGYQTYWHSAQRKGYSGVATFSRLAPTRVYYGLGINKYDVEGRVLRTDFGDWTLLNCYFPNGKSGEQRQKFKMEFLDEFHYWVENLRETRPDMVVAGDYNIAHQNIDIHDPGQHRHTSGFLPEERAWMTNWFASGFVDSFRQLHPDTVSYTWWRATQFARAVNKGWRLDYQSVSDTLMDRIQSAEHLSDAIHSDHCPVLLALDLG
jgi:exodeoxyribonuclease-3